AVPSSTASSVRFLCFQSNARLDRAASVHGRVGVRHVVEVGLESEDATWIAAAIEHIAKQLGDVGARRSYATAQPEIAEDNGLHRVLHSMRDADDSND